jgi:hypothetical protein
VKKVRPYKKCWRIAIAHLDSRHANAVIAAISLNSLIEDHFE